MVERFKAFKASNRIGSSYIEHQTFIFMKAILETDRLLLREYVEEDARAFLS